MVIICECEDNGEAIPPANAAERHELWKQCTEISKRSSGKMDQDFMMTEVYGLDFSSDSMNGDTDLVSASSSFVEVIMELHDDSFIDQVLSYESECLDKSWKHNFHNKLDLFNIGDKDYVILEPCVSGEKVCM